jgi:iron complex outermembrane receptor protein
MSSVSRLSTAAVITSLGLAAVSPAQIVTGTVNGAGSPIVGATVRLLDLDRIVRTGARGEFTFTDVPKGTHVVFAGLSGFKSAVDTVFVSDESSTATFDLTATPIPLKEVIVSASPTARTTDDQYQSTATKSRLELMNSAGMSFADKISDLPGVAVRGNGAAPNRPILRGLGGDEVLVLENGLRVGDISTYDPAHATPIEAASVSQIDVVRGPATILYGPSTIGGLVNVITDIVPRVSDHAISGTAVAEANSVSNQTAGYFDNVFSSANQAFRISAGAVHSGDIQIPSRTYTDPGTGGVFKLDHMPQTFDHSGEAGMGYAYQGDFGSVGIGGKRYVTNYGIPGDPPNPDFLTIPPTTSRIEQQRSTVEFRSLFNVGNPFLKQTRLTAAYNDYAQSEFPTAQDSSGVSDPQANHFHKRAMNAVLQFDQQPIGKLTGTIGLWTNIEDLTIEGDQPLGPNSVTTGLAGYAYEEYIASPRTRLQAAVRYDYSKIQTNPFAASTDSVFQTLDVSRLSNAVTGSVGAIQQLGSHLSGSLSFARSFRAPTVQELFANGLDAASGTYSVGTSTLGPETGMGVDASLNGNFDRVSFQVSPYLNIINHYIYGFLRGDTIQAFPVRQFAATNARLMGFETTVTVQAAQHLAIRASSDYVNAQDTRQDVPLPFTPPLRALLRATYQDGIYTGTMETRMAARQNRLGDGDTPTGGYAIANIGFGMRLPQNRVVSNISIHCDNLFNQVYRDNLSVVKDFIPQPGRGFRLNYEVLY